ncbi:MAG: M15 family metallopeptidase [Myxococcota bacterium]
MIDLLLWSVLLAAPPKPILVDVTTVDQRFLLDIRYATTDNFFGQKVYPVARCLVRSSVATKMKKAQAWLDKHYTGLRLLFKDCYRPHSVQHVLWDAVKGTPKARYVANPNTRTGSIHSYGAAVDVTLANRDGRELDMGTPYDHLGRLAQPRYERKFLKEGKLTDRQVRRRKILRRAMKYAGMRGLRNEWWHFNEGTSKQVRARYRRLDIPLTSRTEHEVPRKP